MSSSNEPEPIPYRSASEFSSSTQAQDVSAPAKPDQVTPAEPTHESTPEANASPLKSEPAPEEKHYKIPHATHQNAYKDDTSMTDPNSLEHAVGAGQKDSSQRPQAYSGSHTVPTISSYEKDREHRQQVADEQSAQPQDEPPAAQEQARQPTKQELNEEQQREKQEMMKRLAPGKKDKPNKLQSKGSRWSVCFISVVSLNFL